MSFVAMEVKTAAEVLGSKNLRVYTFSAPGKEDLIIVANLTNVYSVGDIAAVAQVGTMIPIDSTYVKPFEIIKRKVFGIESSGMAMGRTSAAPGTSLEERCVTCGGSGYAGSDRFTAEESCAPCGGSGIDLKLKK